MLNSDEVKVGEFRHESSSDVVYGRRIEFTVLGEPVAKGRPRVVKPKHLNYPIAYTPKKTRSAETRIRDEALKFMPEVPWEGPVHLRVFFYKQIPKSFPKYRKELAEKGFIRPVTRPDLDNCLKLVKDACNEIIWRDDSQIVYVMAEKFYTIAQPKTFISIILEHILKEWQ